MATVHETETKLSKATTFVVPLEIWGLKLTGGCADSEVNTLLCADTEPAAGNPFLAFADQAEAVVAAGYQRDEWGIECEPVRLK